MLFTWPPKSTELAVRRDDRIYHPYDDKALAEKYECIAAVTDYRTGLTERLYRKPAEAHRIARVHAAYYNLASYDGTTCPALLQRAGYLRVDYAIAWDVFLYAPGRASWCVYKLHYALAYAEGWVLVCLRRAGVLDTPWGQVLEWGDLCWPWEQTRDARAIGQTPWLVKQCNRVRDAWTRRKVQDLR